MNPLVGAGGVGLRGMRGPYFFLTKTESIFKMIISFFVMPIITL